jgi:hypothetical protein
MSGIQIFGFVIFELNALVNLVLWLKEQDYNVGCARRSAFIGWICCVILEAIVVKLSQ